MLSLLEFTMRLDATLARSLEAIENDQFSYQNWHSRATIAPAITSIRVPSGQLLGQSLGFTAAYRAPAMRDVLVVPSAAPKASALSEEPKELIVLDRICGEAVLRGALVFMRGVLDVDGGAAAGTRLPICVWLGATYPRGRAWREQLKHNPEGVLLYIGTGQLSVSRRTIMSQNRGIAVSDIHLLCPQAPSLQDLPPTAVAQNIPSIAASIALDIQAGMSVWDACAGVGGKTSHIATLCAQAGPGVVIASDCSKSKLQKGLQLVRSSLGYGFVLAARADASGIVAVEWPGPPGTSDADAGDEPTEAPSLYTDSTNRLLQYLRATKPVLLNGSSFADAAPAEPVTTTPTVAEATTAKPAKASNHTKLTVLQLPGAPHAALPTACFDRILLDVPCSALGLRPRLDMSDVTMASVRRNSALSKDIIDHAVPLLAPGGVMVLSTCTVTHDENEEVVAYALRRHGLELVPIEPALGGPGISLDESSCSGSNSTVVDSADVGRDVVLRSSFAEAAAVEASASDDAGVAPVPLSTLRQRGWVLTAEEAALVRRFGPGVCPKALGQRRGRHAAGHDAATASITPSKVALSSPDSAAKSIAGYEGENVVQDVLSFDSIGFFIAKFRKL